MNRYFLYYERSVIWFYDEEKPGVWLNSSNKGVKAPYVGLGMNLNYVLFSPEYYKEITEAEARFRSKATPCTIGVTMKTASIADALRKTQWFQFIVKLEQNK